MKRYVFVVPPELKETARFLVEASGATEFEVIANKWLPKGTMYRIDRAGLPDWYDEPSGPEVNTPHCHWPGFWR